MPKRLTSKTVAHCWHKLLYVTGVESALIDPSKLWQNGATESFNGKFRDE